MTKNILILTVIILSTLVFLYIRKEGQAKSTDSLKAALKAASLEEKNKKMYGSNNL